MNALMAAAIVVPLPLLAAAWRFNRTERAHHHKNTSVTPTTLAAGPSIPAGRHDPTHPVVSANTAPQ